MTQNALRMDKPVDTSLLDSGVQGIIGKGIERIDGPLKVAGKATYSAEYEFPNLAYGFLVRAPFAAGTITSIDAEGAKALLAEVGVGNGFSMDLWAMPVQRPYNPNARRIAELMQAGYVS